MKLKNKGQANLVMGLATTAIVLVVLVLVLDQLSTSASVAVSSSTVAIAAYGNTTGYMWTGITLLSVGIILAAGFGLIAMLVMRR